MVSPSPPLRAVAYTFNDETAATVGIKGLPMAEDYPDLAPSAHGYLREGQWMLVDDGAEHDLAVTAATLKDATAAWAERLGHRLTEIVIDPVPPAPADDDADW